MSRLAGTIFNAYPLQKPFNGNFSTPFNRESLSGPYEHFGPFNGNTHFAVSPTPMNVRTERYAVGNNKLDTRDTKARNRPNPTNRVKLSP